MRYDEIIANITTGGEIADSSLPEILDAISQVYPVILMANLTRNN